MDGLPLQDYFKAWADFMTEYKLENLAKEARPTTISWKVATKPDLFGLLVALSPSTQQVHIGTVNERFIASVVLNQPIAEHFRIIKILERRAGSKDRLGLDSVDFLVKDDDQTFDEIEESGADVARQHNDMHAWISLRFGDDDEYEAKFSSHLVLSVAVKELEQSIQEIA